MKTRKMFPIRLEYRTKTITVIPGSAKGTITSAVVA